MAYLGEIIDQAVSLVLPDQRPEFLDALERRFPCIDAAKEGIASPKAPAVPDTSAALEAAVEDDLDDLAERLAEALESTDDQTRQRILSKFEAIGLASDSPGGRDTSPDAQGDAPGLSDRAHQAFVYAMRRLGIKGIDMTRTAKLLVLLMEHLRGVDQLTWSTWRTIAPRSELRRPCDLRKEATRYLNGDRDVSGAELRRHVEALRKLSAAMTAGVGQAGSQFARKHLLKFAPEEIEARANPGGGLLANREYKSWNLYVEMSRDLGEDAIEHAIKEAIVGYTESLLEKSAAQDHAETDRVENGA